MSRPVHPWVRVGALLGLASALASGAAAAPMTFGGWISEWHQDWLVLKTNPTLFDSVAFCWFGIEKDGSLKRSAPKGREAVVAFCRAHGIKTFLTIGGGVEGISGASADRAIQGIVATCATLGFDGVDVDVEELPKTARAAYTEFTGKLRAALKAMTPPRLLSSTLQAVGSAEDEADTFMDYGAIGKLADIVHVMHYDDAFDEAGSLMPRDHFQQQLAFTLSRVPAAKYVPAIPWYGMDWDVKGKSHEDILWRMTNDVDGIYGAQEIITKFGCQPTWNDPGGELTWTYTREGKAHVVWMADPKTFAWMVDAAKRAGVAGVYVWQIEYADPAFMPIVASRLKDTAAR